jgi:hypothetical protein
MAQLAAVGLVGVLLTVAAIVWRNWSLQTGKSRSRSPSFGSVGDLLRVVGGRSLPVEGFEDWKLHYLRIAISALPSQRRLVFRPSHDSAASVAAQIVRRRGINLQGTWPCP